MNDLCNSNVPIVFHADHKKKKILVNNLIFLGKKKRLKSLEKDAGKIYSFCLW